MSYGIFAPLMANVNFGTVTLAVLGVFASLVLVAVLMKGIDRIKAAVVGDRVYIGGRLRDRDVVDSAFESIGRYKKAGGSLDRDTARQYREWRNERARSAL